MSTVIGYERPPGIAAYRAALLLGAGRDSTIIACRFFAANLPAAPACVLHTRALS